MSTKLISVVVSLQQAYHLHDLLATDLERIDDNMPSVAEDRPQWEEERELVDSLELAVRNAIARAT